MRVCSDRTIKKPKIVLGNTRWDKSSFISSNSADQIKAHWIAWTLREAGPRPQRSRKRHPTLTTSEFGGDAKETATELNNLAGGLRQGRAALWAAPQ